MAIKSQRVTVSSDKPYLLNVATDSNAISGSQFLGRNRDASLSIFTGGPDVTAAAGFEVMAGESLAEDLVPGDQLYAITASGSVVVHVQQGNV